MWSGPPKWNGDIINPSALGPMKGKFFALVNQEPFLIQIDGSNDFFFMIFSTEKQLRETVDKFLLKLGGKIDYDIATVPNVQFIDILKELGARIMCNPIVVDENHTKWTEVVKEKDVYKYVDSEIN